MILFRKKNPVLEPGESFVFAYMMVRNAKNSIKALDCDVIFENGPLSIIEHYPECTAKIIDVRNLNGSLLWRLSGTWADPIHIFKIMNDSILEGSKTINDPADYKLVEMLGDYTSVNWNVNGENPDIFMRQSISRKSQYWKADTIPNYSFGNTPDSSMWTYVDNNILLALGYKNADMAVADGLGFQALDPITVHKSTVSSLDYLVSDGYTTPQSIEGVKTATTVADFLLSLIKVDPGQEFSLIAKTDNSVLGSDAPLSDQDTLCVISQDGTNTTKYVLSVSDDGLDSNATLTLVDGSDYVIEIVENAGTISGIDVGTSLKEVLDSVIIPILTLNFDTLSVETQASHLLSFEVVAQDGNTIVYQLEMNLGASDALAFSDMYMVDQDIKMVSLIPNGTRVEAFFTFLKISLGANAILVDKAGNLRVQGNVAFDDLVIVTSEDGSVVNTYNLQFLEENAGMDAFVSSSILTIDQIELMIYDVEYNTEVSAFLELLTPALGASIMVVDDQGEEVTSGYIVEGYQVKVTSADGSKVVFYDITVLVSVGLNRDLEGIMVYPNPTTGDFYLVGLRENCTVRVFNSTGQVVKIFAPDVVSGGFLSISDQPAGLYYITVKADNYHLKSLQIIRH
jgi:hypothetical protein